jgi:hypothetical protein
LARYKDQSWLFRLDGLKSIKSKNGFYLGLLLVSLLSPLYRGIASVLCESSRVPSKVRSPGLGSASDDRSVLILCESVISVETFVLSEVPLLAGPVPQLAATRDKQHKNKIFRFLDMIIEFR